MLLQKFKIKDSTPDTYNDDAKFRRMQLKGAISLSELESKLESLPKSQEIIFYCA